jgi:hypothetical protein
MTENGKMFMDGIKIVSMCFPPGILDEPESRMAAVLGFIEGALFLSDEEKKQINDYIAHGKV